MKINLVCVEDSIMAFPARKMASFVKSIHANTQLYFVPYMVNRTNLRVLLGNFGDINKEGFDPNDIRQMAEPLSQAEIVGFSSMTGYSDMTRALIKEIRYLNPNAFIIWGGIHPIIDPEDAIKSAD
ncbi:MAG: cobalamin-dependent protein, partial [Nitrospinota bacterium]|nr:cobalamin-dependent protein [Nitrospinota bacterium]